MSQIVKIVTCRGMILVKTIVLVVKVLVKIIIIVFHLLGLIILHLILNSTAEMRKIADL